MNDPNTLIEGIEGLDDLCSNNKVSIIHSQSTSFLNILEHYYQNPEIIEHIVILINKILQFDEEWSSESFCNDYFLNFFFSNLNSPYSIDSLYHISKTKEYCAIPILQYINNSTEILDFLLSKESENFELNLNFLSAFLPYKDDDFVELISRVIHKIFDLLESELLRSSRNSCLSFINDALNSRTSIFDIILDNEKFPSIFQSEPSNRSERIIKLKILNSLQRNFKIHHDENAIENQPKTIKMTTTFEKLNNGSLNFDDDQDITSLFEPIEDDSDESESEFDCVDNTATVILKNGLFDFVVSCLKVDMDHLYSELNFDEVDVVDFDVACYALDVIKEMATNGVDVVQFLYQEEIVQIVWDLLNSDGHYYKNVCSLMTLLEVFKSSTNEQKISLIQNGLFDICSQNFDIFTDRFLSEMLNDLKGIMVEARNEGNELILNSIFETQSLMEQIEELSVDCSEPAAPIADDILAFVKCLIEGNEEEDNDDDS